MDPTSPQFRAITTEGHALLVEAGAGTGKTWVLVERMMHLLAQHPEWPLESIVAVTFTEKATREMRSRIRQGVEARAATATPGSPWHARVQQVDRLQVSTLHTLCARILRENAIVAQVDPRFGVLDEQEALLLQGEAIQQTLAHLARNGDASLALLDSLRLSDLQRELGALLAQRGTVGRLFDGLPEASALLSHWRAGVAAMQEALWQQVERDDAAFRAAREALSAAPRPTRRGQTAAHR